MSRALVGAAGDRPLLRTYAWLILTITLVTMAAATTIVALRPSTYASSSSVVVEPESTTGTPLEPDMGTEQQIALSGEVATRAAARLGLPPDAAADGLSVSVPIETNALEITYSAGSPQEAFQGAKAFTKAYVTYRNEQTIGPDVARVITHPTFPSAPSSTNFPLVIGLSLVLGAMIGVGTALVWDKTTDRLRSVEDTEALTGLPVLASVPRLKSGKPNRMASRGGAPTLGAEALGYLTVQLTHVMTTRRASSVLVTSPSPGAGKTTMAVSVATALARLGKNVVFVDVLNGTTPLHQKLRAHDLDGLRVVTCETDAAQGAVNFNLEDLALLLAELTPSADLVVVDAPTVLGAPDTPMLAELVDAVLLVVDLRYGRRDDATAAVSALSHVDHKLVGFVANRPRRQPRGLLRTLTDRPTRSDVPESREAKAPVVAAPELQFGPGQAADAQSSNDAGLGILRRSERPNGDVEERQQRARRETSLEFADHDVQTGRDGNQAMRDSDEPELGSDIEAQADASGDHPDEGGYSTEFESEYAQYGAGSDIMRGDDDLSDVDDHIDHDYDTDTYEIDEGISGGTRHLTRGKSKERRPSR
jgi:tyrosine-protein kinase